MNREHCLFGADRCVAVTPSDTGPALVALDARMVIRNSDGEREVAAEEFFIGPDVDIERMTVLDPGDILTAIRIPNTWSGATFYFEKVADRKTWDFPLVNIAAAMRITGGTIEDIRIVAGGVECIPRRMTVVEDIVKGSAQDEEIAMLAGSSAIRGATPLNYNQFKVPLLEKLVTRAIRDA
jgi:xanthine dehydrogenase YagS FAD-binding subunit